MKREGTVIGSRIIAQPFTVCWLFPPSSFQRRKRLRCSQLGWNELRPNEPKIDRSGETDAANGKSGESDVGSSCRHGYDVGIRIGSGYHRCERRVSGCGVAAVRHIPMPQMKQLITAHTEHRQFKIFGEERVNVLEINLALDSLAAHSGKQYEGRSK